MALLTASCTSGAGFNARPLFRDRDHFGVSESHQCPELPPGVGGVLIKQEGAECDGPQALANHSLRVSVPPRLRTIVNVAHPLLLLLPRLDQKCGTCRTLAQLVPDRVDHHARAPTNRP